MKDMVLKNEGQTLRAEEKRKNKFFDTVKSKEERL
jgi:hypothetical protein